MIEVVANRPRLSRTQPSPSRTSKTDVESESESSAIVLGNWCERGLNHELPGIDFVGALPQRISWPGMGRAGRNQIAGFEKES